MKWINPLLWLFAASIVRAQSIDGIYNLLKRRIPDHVDSFRFTLDPQFTNGEGYDHFVVQSATNGTILVHGNTLSALLTGYVISKPFINFAIPNKHIYQYTSLFE